MGIRKAKGNGNGPLAKPPPAAETIIRRHRAHSQDEALKRFQATTAQRQTAGLYPIALSWSGDDGNGSGEGVELAVTYLRREG